MADSEQLRSLIERAQRGDTSAYEALIDRYRQRLERSVRARLGHVGVAAIEADEIVQETLVRGLQAIERFRWEGEDSLYRWLAGISRRVILAAARQRRADGNLDQARRVAARDVTPSRALSREERFHRFRAALSGLGEHDREVILLTRIEGLTTSEVAERMGRSPDAVRQLLSRALRKLRKAFGDTESLALPERSLDADGSAAKDGVFP